MEHLRKEWRKIAASDPLWHVTTNARFTLDPDYAPQGGSGMGAVFGKGLFLTTNPELWRYLWRTDSYAPSTMYAAEVSAPTAQRLGSPDDDRDQWWVPAEDYDSVSVLRVVPIEQAEREARRRGHGFAMLAADAIDRSRICVVDHRQGWGNPTALCGGVTDGNPIKWTTTEWVKTGPMASRICPECMEALR